MEPGTLIKKFRTQKQLTQKQLGELCLPPIAESTIRRYELGKLNPKIETMQKIADALAVPLYKFYINDTDVLSPDIYIETRKSSSTDEQIKRLIQYCAKLNSLGLSELEIYIQELIKTKKFLK